MLFVVHYIGEQFIVCLFYQFFDSFVVLTACPVLPENGDKYQLLLIDPRDTARRSPAINKRSSVGGIVNLADRRRSTLSRCGRPLSSS